MAADKCSGCQSFCMRGGQVVGSDQRKKSTDTNYDASKEEFKNYNDLKDWEQWKNFTNGANGTTICSPTGLTAISQKDLADFIKIAYNEGKFNPVKNNMFSEDQIKNKDKISNFATLSKDSGYRFESSDYNTVTKDYENGGSITSNSIIHKEHYNGFLNQLANNSGNVVKQSDLPNGDKIRIPSNGNGGPQVAISGKTISESDGIENKNGGMDGSLITAKAYVDLAKQASKLLYHPFQCNVCNVCEGGKFGEIVRELGTALRNAGWLYSQTHYENITGTFGGITGTFNIRHDCSGFVSACVSIYAMAEGETTYYDSCQQSSSYYTDGTFNHSDLFIPAKDSDNANVIFADHNDNSQHVEASDDEGRVWSGGGDGRCRNGQPGNCKETGTMMHEKAFSNRRKRWVAKGSSGMGGEIKPETGNCYEDEGCLNNEENREPGYIPPDDSGGGGGCSETGGGCSETGNECGQLTPCSTRETWIPDCKEWADCNIMEHATCGEITPCEQTSTCSTGNVTNNPGCINCEDCMIYVQSGACEMQTYN